MDKNHDPMYPKFLNSVQGISQEETRIFYVSSDDVS